MRARKKFDVWVADVAGEDVAARTEADWKKVADKFDIDRYRKPEDETKRPPVDESIIIGRMYQSVRDEIETAARAYQFKLAQIKRAKQSDEEDDFSDVLRGPQ